MTSLAEVYEGKVGEYASLRRLYLGVGLFLLGALLVVCGIVVAGTDPAIDALGLTEARQYGGVLGGLGVPAVFLGIFTVLPAERRTRAAAVVGAGVAVLGVALFAHAYPCQWSGSNCGAGLVDLTIPTAAVYFLGSMTTFWCLFVGVANFKSRNDPGGTVRLQVTREGETEIIEVPRSQVSEVQGAKGAMGGLGGIGFMGNTPDGDVETQTNRGGTRRAGPATGADPAASDGGASTQDIRSLRDDTSPSASTESTTSTRSPSAPSSPSNPRPSPTEPASSSAGGSAASASGRTGNAGGGADGRAKNAGDAYCGSCGHFQYVRTENGMQPYCGLHDDLMDDMEACEEWNPR
ncbi:ribonuclease BN [Halorarum halophilum]|uniref:Ribonuclease BN n=1 Tax=Halorarum halophilum TaxID=2743090 RepID=A0A7D5GD00_9EURY|nr:ribonuclease BN [Halobaculum halophilum]QLG28605.1 ribonuclease BN [Halobaculum halophilum]